MSYRFAIEGRALEKLLARPPREHWILHDLCAGLARHPYVEPDLWLTGDDVRPLAVRVSGSILVHYWIDHTAMCVNVVDFDFVEVDGR